MPKEVSPGLLNVEEDESMDSSSDSDDDLEEEVNDIMNDVFGGHDSD